MPFITVTLTQDLIDALDRAAPTKGGRDHFIQNAIGDALMKQIEAQSRAGYLKIPDAAEDDGIWELPEEYLP